MRNVVDYYRRTGFNPVPLDLGEEAVRRAHVGRRVHLYQDHLHIPLGWLAGREVIEFGCNTGENALVLAAYGARLTLVEPQPEACERLLRLFERFGLKDRITVCTTDNAETYVPDRLYDFVIAEGFLSMMPDGLAVLRRVLRCVAPGGIGVVSFNDLHGCLLEFVRMAMLRRILDGEGIEDPASDEALAAARKAFAEDFDALPGGRPLEAWWRDNFLNPYVRASYCWTWPGFLAASTDAGCFCHGTSPPWLPTGPLAWYKQVASPEERRRFVLGQWRSRFAYFLTGSSEAVGGDEVPGDLIEAVETWGLRLSDYASGGEAPPGVFETPPLVADFLEGKGIPGISLFLEELESLLEAMQAGNPEEILGRYHRSRILRRVWGVPYQYVALSRPPAGVL